MEYDDLFKKRVELGDGKIHLVQGRRKTELTDVQIGEWWITTAENAAQGQADWSDDDLWKNVDFTVAPYWVYSEDGERWSPIKDQAELEQFLKE